MPSIIKILRQPLGSVTSVLNESDITCSKLALSLLNKDSPPELKKDFGTTENL